MKSKLEYIWLDGSEPTQALRSKTTMSSEGFTGALEDVKDWSFAGSATYQTHGEVTDCVLKPVFVCPDPARKNAYLVLCEVYTVDGKPHPTNFRSTIESDDDDFWFGYEQEYFLYDMDTRLPLGFPKGGYPTKPQGPYYCGVGAQHVAGRHIVEEHFDLCLDAGLNIEGINAEVALGQWEFQIFAKGAKRAADEIWLARYLLERTCEKYNVYVEWHPKPLGQYADWNGSGMHANFSNSKMRTSGDKKVFEEICETFGRRVKEHIDVYGAHNEERLSGKHDTASIHDFSYSVSNRIASIRIPIATVESGWRGRLEDRRPASNGCPYKIGAAIVKTVKESGHI